MAKQLARELIGAGVHFGHSASRWNPKMAPFIFAKRGKIHIIDVRKTLAGVFIAKKLVTRVVSSGKDVVFVGTKRQAQKPVKTTAEKCGMHYVSERWLGGMLTNFRTIRSRLKRLEQLEAMQEDGSLKSDSKKQASRLKREMRKIKTNLSGIQDMSRLPGLVVVVDSGKEHLALQEAQKLGIPAIGIIDTDCDPDMMDVAIPGNDDSIKAIELILNELADAVAIGKTMVQAAEQKKPHMAVRKARRALATADKRKTRSRKKAETENTKTASAAPQQTDKEEPEKEKETTNQQ